MPKKPNGINSLHYLNQRNQRCFLGFFFKFNLVQFSLLKDLVLFLSNF